MRRVSRVKKASLHLREEEEDDVGEGVEGPEPLWVGEGGCPLVVPHDHLHEGVVLSATGRQAVTSKPLPGLTPLPLSGFP